MTWVHQKLWFSLTHVAQQMAGCVDWWCYLIFRIMLRCIILFSIVYQYIRVFSSCSSSRCLCLRYTHIHIPSLPLCSHPINIIWNIQQSASNELSVRVLDKWINIYQANKYKALSIASRFCIFAYSEFGQLFSAHSGATSEMKRKWDMKRAKARRESTTLRRFMLSWWWRWRRTTGLLVIICYSVKDTPTPFSALLNQCMHSKSNQIKSKKKR